MLGCSTNLTNHLDAESVDWLEQFLLRFPGMVVARLTHDVAAFDNAPLSGFWNRLGAGIPREGNYSSWLDSKQARLETRRSDRIGIAKPPCAQRIGRARQTKPASLLAKRRLLALPSARFK